MKTSFGRLARALGTMALVAGAPGPFAGHAAGTDVPCRVEQRERIVFPVRLLSEGVLRGDVLLMLDVQRTGELVDVLAFSYTHREFADAALQAIRRWKFTAGHVDGQPVGSIITLNVQFEVAGVLAYVKPLGSTTTDDSLGDRLVYQPVAPDALDRLPTALARPGPIYPREWINQGRAGDVTVDFFIDETGQVRFPRVVGPSDELLGAAAVAAVKEWRFEPPRRHRRPVLTRARQVFHFQPPPEPPVRGGVTPSSVGVRPSP